MTNSHDNGVIEKIFEMTESDTKIFSSKNILFTTNFTTNR